MCGMVFCGISFVHSLHGLLVFLSVKSEIKLLVYAVKCTIFNRKLRISVSFQQRHTYMSTHNGELHFTSCLFISLFIVLAFLVAHRCAILPMNLAWKCFKFKYMPWCKSGHSHIVESNANQLTKCVCEYMCERLISYFTLQIPWKLAWKPTVMIH